MTDRRRPQRRAASAIPTEIPADESLTPPPIDISDIEKMGDTVPPPVREQLTVMANWIDKLASERTSAARFDRFDSILGSIAKSVTRHEALLDDLLVPQLDKWRATTDLLSQQVPRLVHSIESMTLLVGDLDRRLRSVEITVAKMVDRIQDDTRDVETKLADLQRANVEHARSIVELKQINNDKSIASTAIAKRDKWWLAAISAAFGFVAGIAPRVVEFFTK